MFYEINTFIIYYYLFYLPARLLMRTFIRKEEVTKRLSAALRDVGSITARNILGLQTVVARLDDCVC